MRTVACDHCGSAKLVPAMARPDHWSSLRMTVRAPYPGSDFFRSTKPVQYELCPVCTTEISAYLTKLQRGDVV
jgi:hypothetical protein